MYLEYVFLTNWAVNSAAMTLSLSFVKRNADVTRLLVGAAFIAADAFFTFDGAVTASAIRLIFALFGSWFITFDGPPAATVGVFFAFVLFSAAINGAAYALSVKFPSLNKAVFSASLSTAIIVVTAISELVTAMVYDRKKVSDYIYDVRIMSDNGEVVTQGYYDSGNTMTENGMPVVILSRKFARKCGICGQKSLFVSTVTGVKRLRASPVKIAVYFNGGTHKVYETFGAIAESNVKADVILHSSMMED